MRTEAFDFSLPPHLIAQHPLPHRTDSRLLVYERSTQMISHQIFHQLIDFLRPGDLLVFNNSKVIQARLFAKKQTGGRVEILVERRVSPYLFLAHLRASKLLNIGSMLTLTEGEKIWIEEKRPDGLYLCRVEHPLAELLAKWGHMPLPPYIQRQDDITDFMRYQTVYANPEGSVAAPTAGLHFDENMLLQLSQAEIHTGFVTLHVGAGTFQPVRTEWIHEHQIHQEWMTIDEALCQQIDAVKAQAGRVIAVGTTALRALETAGRTGQIKPFSGETSIFIYPGYTFQIVDGLLTNFHVPKSTLLMLVAALIGYEQTMHLYQQAINQAYRFLSYGDVSLLL